MGKIRSTLDIVMEKTKNLSMSLDDKKSIRRRELSDLARAAVQKYLGNKASLQGLASELDAAGTERPELLALVRQDLLENIQVEGDNRRVLDALESLCGADRGKAEKRILDFRARLEGDMEHLMAELRTDLQSKGIRGEAVIPNIAGSSAWRDRLSQARHDLAAELGSAL